MMSELAEFWDLRDSTLVTDFVSVVVWREGLLEGQTQVALWFVVDV